MQVIGDGVNGLPGVFPITNLNLMYSNILLEEKLQKSEFYRRKMLYQKRIKKEVLAV